MLLIPAVDILNGKPVQLLQGDYDHVTSYGDSPLDAALRWRDAGANWLHVVDLDGARNGLITNGDAIRSIIERSGLKVEVGGGVRTTEDAERLIEWGAERVVIGTRAVEDAKWFREVCDRLPGRAVAALDAKHGKIAVRGWEQATELSVPEATSQVEECGASRILFTAIEQDGTLTGPNIPALRELLSRTHLPVIASGGVGSPEHLEALSRTGAEAAIVGTALYEGKVPLSEIRKYRR